MAVIKIYRLTPAGRSIIFADWLNQGGCGVPNWGQGELCYYFRTNLAGLYQKTLGELADAAPGVGRSLARFAFDRLGREDWAEVDQ